MFSAFGVVPVLAMPLHSTSGSSSIFENGKLKPGFYKIQNLFSETYLDIHRHSREVCCRPAQDIEGGRGIVRLHLQSAFAYLMTRSGRSRGLGLDIQCSG